MQNRFGGHFEPFKLCFLQSLGLRPPVLEPDLHLRLGQAERIGKFSTFGYRQVLLLTKPPLEGQELSGSERGSRFTGCLVFPERACCGTLSAYKMSALVSS